MRDSPTSKLLALRLTGGVVLLLAITIRAEEFRSVARFRTEREAVEAGERLGVGRARLDGPASVEVMQHGTWTLVYTAGRAAIEPGGGIRVALRHVHQWSEPQIARPEHAGYLTARA